VPIQRQQDVAWSQPGEFRWSARRHTHHHAARRWP
jgi:hypothetical protein